MSNQVELYTIIIILNIAIIFNIIKRVFFYKFYLQKLYFILFLHHLYLLVLPQFIFRCLKSLCKKEITRTFKKNCIYKNNILLLYYLSTCLTPGISLINLLIQSIFINIPIITSKFTRLISS